MAHTNVLTHAYSRAEAYSFGLSYTRAKAIESGDLIDVSDVARQTGFLFPVALSRAVMIDCVKWGVAEKNLKPAALQNEAGRLWDVLHLAYVAAKMPSSREARSVEYQVYRVPVEGLSLDPAAVRLRLTIGHDEGGRSVMTICFPEEA
ncbi:DUF6573 family protein (plasmid) [Pseudomonas alloputida]|uniref:DUF6573 family protein n=1 Tax=Pseudomonas alloputida TaxID=1940621 RepID=UPI003B4397EC